MFSATTNEINVCGNVLLKISLLFSISLAKQRNVFSVSDCICDGGF
jgi:hypothetical protein